MKVFFFFNNLDATFKQESPDILITATADCAYGVERAKIVCFFVSYHFLIYFFNLQ